jgi:IS30 family transposase
MYNLIIADLCVFTSPLLIANQAFGTEYMVSKLRRFFPKKTDLSAVTDQQVKQVEQYLNDRPVRKFNYRTPNQVLQGKIALIT